ncbi:hypothetical protein OQH61_09205 [Helicobacter sp. MIT 21-1697]|uniref:hypothetical protein n=1 Tax=Helicobacter sp. MIT 21-1697 TaxID=2993733 RepID=UPI00224B8C90|nr:hypothetical protein [Helicobacter sp. MIT 21-1697]MCX2717908.1 hypothetical protein [Helicobacter sp. MIT 21-1697]
MSKNQVGHNAKESINLENLYQYKDLEAFGKIAYIDTGTLSMNSVGGHFLYKHILQYINLYEEFESIVLEDFCAVVLPMGIDEVYLSYFKDKILHYLHNGGVVLSFMSDYMQILPFSSGYIQSLVPIKERVIQITSSDAAKVIFDGVREYDINYRRGVKGFFNRGYFDKTLLPQGVEIFLEDSEGQCVGYIDRDSTNGIILSTANADLLGFGLFDNTSARKMGLNLLKWLSNQLQSKDYKALREKASSLPNPTPSNSTSYRELSFLDFISDKSKQNLSNPLLKNAIITGGSSFNAHFFSNKNAKYAHFFSHRYHFLDIDSIHFQDFDYIVLASRLNSAYLMPHKQKFIDYLQSGGHIISFGEIEKDYLPNIVWKDYPVNFWWWLIQGADMPLYALESDGSKQEGRTKSGLFSKMEVSTAKWHYHGAFYPPSNATKILVNELDESIIYKDNSFKGNLYVTSLDPEFHLGQGFMPTTEPFFDTFMQWVEEDIMQSAKNKG